MLSRRVTVDTNTIFKKPLIVYKIITDIAFKYALEVIFYLSQNPEIEAIFIEDLSLINTKTILKHLQEHFQNNTEITKNIESRLSNNPNFIKQFDKNSGNSPDLAIVIGGDGTTLWTSHIFGTKPKPPFLNFNLGTLGYMAIYSCNDLIKILDEIYSPMRLMSFEKRGLLSVKIFEIDLSKNDENEIEKEFDPIDPVLINEMSALNDVILEKTATSNLTNLKVFIDNEPLTIVKSDGIIISTPTGSTAYNLSAGGPIVHYDVNSLILNAICPMSLSFRPIILSTDMCVRFVPNGRSIGKVQVNSDCIEKKVIEENQYAEIRVCDRIDFIVLENYVSDRVALWRNKVIGQLGWNNAFKNN